MSRLKNKGSGPDGVPSWVYKNFVFFLSPAITSLFNRSIRDGVFGSTLKFANVTPVPKCSRPQSVSQFRPISVLPVLSKVFEKIILHEFLLPSTSLKLKSSQFAYIRRPGSGTTAALVSVQTMIVHHLDSPGAVRILSIDFKKAFDKLPHSSILSSCLSFNIEPCLLNLIPVFFKTVGNVSILKVKFLSASQSLVVFHKEVFWARFSFAWLWTV